MKKKIIYGLICGLLLTGCGSSKSDDRYLMDDGVEYTTTAGFYESVEDKAEGGDLENNSLGDSGSENSGLAAESSNKEAMSQEIKSSDVELETTESGNAADNNVDSNEDIKNASTQNINKEMLVYRGDICFDTLEFEQSVDDFKRLLEENEGFIFSANYSDGYSTSKRYRVDDSKKQNTYTATVRVPSKNYDNLMNSITTLGDVRSQNSNVTNVTQQYNTYTSELEIYQAEYNRYIKLLEEAKTDEAALEIEDKLFDLQLRIADLKSGIGNIEMDVAYSYITVTIREVEEYVKDPEPEDTFADRLKKTCKETYESFLEGLEVLFFGIIRNIVGIVIVLIAFIIVLGKVRKGKKAGKKANEKVNEIVNENANGKANEIVNEKANEIVNANANEIVNEKANEIANEIVNENVEENANGKANEKE